VKINDDGYDLMHVSCGGKKNTVAETVQEET
jgi:hypothetical protein